MWKTIKDWFGRIHYILNPSIDKHSLTKDGWKYQKSKFIHGYEWVLKIETDFEDFELVMEQVDTYGKYGTWEVSYSCTHFGKITRKVSNRYELYLFVNALTLNLNIL